jgi:hypothetical protein
MGRQIEPPKCPSRQEILDTVGDQGMKHWRNPMHLRAVDKNWPKPTTQEGRGDMPMIGMQLHPEAKKGRFG